MVAEGSEVAIESSQFGAAPVVVGVLGGGNRYLHLRCIGSRFRVLRVHKHEISRGNSTEWRLSVGE